MTTLRTLALAAAAALGCHLGGEPPVELDARPDFLAVRFVDLTHAFGEDTIYWPTGDRFALTEEAAGTTEGGYYYSAYSFCAAEHGGTHLDAPVHFAERGWKADEIPLERMIGLAVLVDVAGAVGDDRDHLVSIADLAEWERRHGAILRGAIVLLRTGWGARWPDAERYLGTAERGPDAAAKLHFPGLDPEAARWLVEERAIHAIGIDTASIDHGPSKGFEAHRILLGANVAVFENVANLDRLPARDFSVIALPMKIRGGSGGPLRIVAVLPKAD